MSGRRSFGERDLAALGAAVAAAESRSAGEIVTTVVDRCDSYQGALWKGAALGATAASLAAALLHGALEVWGGSPWLWLALPSWAGAGLGYLVPLLAPPLHRALVGAEVLELRVERRARAAFLENEVFATRARTGVLLFVARFERRVWIGRDRGVEEKVPAAEWAPIVERLAAGLRSGRTVEAMVASIGEIGDLLAARDVTAPGEDIDELPDAPTVSER